LLDATPEDVQTAFRQTSAPREFSVYARGFFTRLLGETLRYWLDRELAAHVGDEQRFRDAGDRSAFDQAVMQYCSEATFIIREFSAGWYAKNLRDGRQITEGVAAAYGSVALKKILEELTLKWGP